MISQATLDVNVLVYAIDRRELRKHEIAERLVGACLDAGARLPLQALNDALLVATSLRAGCVTLFPKICSMAGCTTACGW